MKIQLHIGKNWQIPGHKPLVYEFPELSGNLIPANEVVKNIRSILRSSTFAKKDDVVDVITLSPIVFDTIRLMKKTEPNSYQVIVFFDGISEEVDNDGRMKNYPSEFDVHINLIGELLDL